MSTDSISQSDLFEEMNAIIEQKHYIIFQKSFELATAKKKKAPDVQDRTDELTLLSEDLDRVMRIYNSYMKFRKQNGHTKPKEESLAVFSKLIADMKSQSMGDIVSTVPKN